jgi:hypothetical protein
MAPRAIPALSGSIVVSLCSTFNHQSLNFFQMSHQDFTFTISPINFVNSIITVTENAIIELIIGYL